MNTEYKDKIKKILEDKAGQVKFLSTSAEFLDYVEGDCAGLSPGLSFFEQSAFGLRHLAEKIPQHKALFEDAATIYDTLAAKAPGAMYPRGSEMFSDLTKVSSVRTALSDIVESG